MRVYARNTAYPDYEDIPDPFLSFFTTFPQPYANA
jgi:hypothetical protein